MEHVALPAGAHPRWRKPTLTLLGALLLGAALALGGGDALLWWGLAGIARAPLIVASLLGLYVAPGLALLQLLWPRERPLGLAARLSLAFSLSAALPPLLLLLAQQIGLPWGSVATWIYLLMSLLVLANAHMRVVGEHAAFYRWRARDHWPASLVSASDGAGVALFAISLAALLVRLYIVRDLPAGMLGDSYHHTLITQLLADNQGVFRSWQPYAPLTTFTYHFGFHANAAFIHWLTGIDVVHSVIWAGQIFNAMAVPLAFALVASLGGRRWAGVWAALITGFALTLPAFYVNWGRYTQLTGQVVLVGVVACWAALADLAADSYQQGAHARFSAAARWRLGGMWRPILLAAIATTAMILTHYLVTIFAALFVASYLLALCLTRRSWLVVGRVALAAALTAVLALFLTSPWLLNLLNGYLVRNAASFVQGGVEAVRVEHFAAIPQVVPLYAKGYVLLGALLGLCVAGWRRDWRMALPGVWSVLLALCVVPRAVGLPGTGAIDALTAFSALYLTTAPLAGCALAAVQEQAAALLARMRAPAALGSALAGVFLLAAVAFGAADQINIIKGETALVTHADVAAMAWIRDHTPPDARFLVNSFPAYGGTLAAGVDAGWWLPLLAGRQASLPPITYGSELGEQPDYARRVNALAAALRGRPLTDAQAVRVDLTNPAAIQLLRDAGIAYVYSGAHPFPDPAVADRIDTSLLRNNPNFRLIYHQDGVEIFQLVEGAS